MKRIMLIGAALLTVSVFVSQPSLALPEKPIKDVPMLYDANNKLVGPYYLNTTYLTIDGQLYSVSIGREGFNQNLTFYVYYTKDDCKGDTYTATTAPTIGLSPQILASEGSLYYPVGEPKTISPKSYRILNTTGDCTPFSNTVTALRSMKKDEKFLGIKFPTRLKVAQ